MSVVEQAFRRRAAQIAPQGLGLSVDIYTPDLFELMDALEQAGACADYLEVFRSSLPALQTVRQRCPSLPLECHAEGLWLTQPDWREDYPAEREMDALAEQLRTLGSRWMTHECAAKQMVGYAFGTYLPPLFTQAAADVTAENLAWAQARLDREAVPSEGASPLILLEVPPWTYFGLGDLSVPAFFRRIAERAACGLVLDIGHLWTVYRYSGAWRLMPVSGFVAEFLETFPVERIVQIHVAGLAEHETGGQVGRKTEPPLWIDQHGVPIPPVLFEMLEQVLAHPKLTQLKGLALEVDTKDIPTIVREFRHFRERFAGRLGSGLEPAARSESAEAVVPPSAERPVDVPALLRQYEAYAQLVSGQNDALMPWLIGDPSGLDRYRCEYLPHEILHWGGELTDMFPATCRRLAEAQVDLRTFLGYWFREPSHSDAPYDFFLLKVERFEAFVGEVLPDAGATVAREAAELRGAYQAANVQVGR